jgi:thioredoxin-disulfide reductase
VAKEEYDFVIIGAGVAGLAAAMYGARLGMKTLCLGTATGSEDAVGGTITTTFLVENYPGFPKTSGRVLAESIKNHALLYPLVSLKEEKVLDVQKNTERFSVKSAKEEYSGKTILFATGSARRKIDVPGSKEFEHKGLTYCALCDAPLFKNKNVAVIGGSNCAVADALILSQHAKKVYIIYRKEKLRADSANVKKIEENEKIEVITNTNVVEVKGDKVVRSVMLDREYKGNKELKLDGVFVEIGNIPISELAEKLGVAVNSEKEIIINHKTTETNIPGVFAAGDVVDKPFKQAIIGVAEGCTAAWSAFMFLGKEIKK